MAAKNNATGKGSGQRRRFAGKTGVRTKVRGGYVVTMRAHSHGGHSPARDGYECGQNKPYQKVPGQFRVPAPTKRVHRKGTFGSIS
jgi:hypothetical protein